MSIICDIGKFTSKDLYVSQLILQALINQLNSFQFTPELHLCKDQTTQTILLMDGKGLMWKLVDNDKLEII